MHRAVVCSNDSGAGHVYRLRPRAARLRQWLPLALVLLIPAAGQAQRLDTSAPGRFNEAMPAASRDTPLVLPGVIGGYHRSTMPRVWPHAALAAPPSHAGIATLSISANFVDARLPCRQCDLPPDERPSVVPYVIGGALVGAAAMTLGLYLDYRLNPAQESLMHPLALTPAVLAGAAVGAAAGWLIHRLRTH